MLMNKRHGTGINNLPLNKYEDTKKAGELVMFSELFLSQELLSHTQGLESSSSSNAGVAGPLLPVCPPSLPHAPPLDTLHSSKEVRTGHSTPKMARCHLPGVMTASCPLWQDTGCSAELVCREDCMAEARFCDRGSLGNTARDSPPGRRLPDPTPTATLNRDLFTEGPVLAMTGNLYTLSDKIISNPVFSRKTRP